MGTQFRKADTNYHDLAIGVEPSSIIRLLPACPAGLPAADWRAAIEARIEHHQDIIEALVRALDLREPDADYEPGSDEEPSLGWSSCEAQYGRYVVSQTMGTDLEDDGVME